jgi:hypothetical protein
MRPLTPTRQPGSNPWYAMGKIGEGGIRTLLLTPRICGRFRKSAIEMGGFGSGRHVGAKKPRVEAHDALKVSDLRRERIPPGATGFTLSYQLHS